MPPTLESALERISELEGRIARLERIVIGNGELAANTHTPTHASQPFSNGETIFPQLNAEFEEAQEKTASEVKSSQPEIIHITSALETIFPKIAENLTLVWGHPECEGYLNKLIIDNRGNRQGFSLDIICELLLLTSITECKDIDIWTPGNHR